MGGKTRERKEGHRKGGKKIEKKCKESSGEKKLLIHNTRDTVGSKGRES